MIYNGQFMKTKKKKQIIARELLQGTQATDLIKESQQGTGKVAQFSRPLVYRVKKSIDTQKKALEYFDLAIVNLELAKQEFKKFIEENT